MVLNVALNAAAAASSSLAKLSPVDVSRGEAIFGSGGVMLKTAKGQAKGQGASDEVDARVADGKRTFTVSVALADDECFGACSCRDGSDCAHVAAVLAFMRDRAVPADATGAGSAPRRSREAESAAPATGAVPPAEAPSAPKSAPDALAPQSERDAPPETVARDEGRVASQSETPEPLGAAHEAWIARLSGAPRGGERDESVLLPHYVLRRNVRGDYQVSFEALSFIAHFSRRSRQDTRVEIPFDELFRQELVRADLRVLEALERRQGYGASVIPLDPAEDAAVFAALLRTGRAYLEVPGGQRTLLRRGRERLGALTYAIDPVAGAQLPVVQVGVRVGVRVDAGGGDGPAGANQEALALGQPPTQYFDPRTAEVGELVFDVSDDVVEAWSAGYVIGPGQTKAVREALAARGLAGPKDVVRATVPVAVKARLESPAAERRGGTGDARLHAVVEASPGVWARLESIAPKVVEDETTITLVGPDPAPIHALTAALTAGGFKPLGARSGASHLVLGDGSIYEVEHAARAALRGTSFEVETTPDYAFGSTAIGDAELGLRDDGDAYAAGLTVDLDGQKVDILPALLDSLRGQTLPKYGVAVEHAGKTFFLPVERVESIRSLLLELAERRGGPRVPRLRALGLPPGILPRAPESLETLRRELRSPREVEVPAALVATLRAYQIDGFRWLDARRRLGLGAVLADDMGLGKTIQTIALFLSEREAEHGGTVKVAPSLVVCPKSVAPNWFDELRRFAPSLRVLEHHGKDRASDDDAFAEADVIVTTYPILVRDGALFAKRSFSTIVLDEAQSIKNPASAVALAAFGLNGAFRLALTGTPLENHLGELWSLFRYVLPELLPDAKAFGKIYRRPVEHRGDAEARAALRGRLFPFLLRRTKELVARDLPPKTLVVTRVELEPAQRDVYETIRASMSARVAEALATRGLQEAQIIILDALLKLRQAVCDPQLLKLAAAKKAGSAKLTHLVAMVTELVAEGRRVLVFSQFVTMLERIEAELGAAKIPYTMLTGQTENRRSVVAEFATGEVPVFLLSLKAGGTGLNLTAADVVIHYDPWWNPAAENQATDRAHRIGQTQPVFVYKLIGKETIEEKILALQERKQALFASILDDGSEVAKRLTEDDVRFLFS
ncbi:MAG: SWIM zinc finger family protein [Myxococcales bacterium]|nr:SWIM zinc finger family protein [Myxococcales bacterium]